MIVLDGDAGANMLFSNELEEKIQQGDNYLPVISTTSAAQTIAANDTLRGQLLSPPPAEREDRERLGYPRLWSEACDGTNTHARTCMRVFHESCIRHPRNNALPFVIA